MDLETLWMAAALSRMGEDAQPGAFGTTYLAVAGMMGAARQAGFLPHRRAGDQVQASRAGTTSHGADHAARHALGQADA
jgi:hypothetical protein